MPRRLVKHKSHGKSKHRHYHQHYEEPTYFDQDNDENYEEDQYEEEEAEEEEEEEVEDNGQEIKLAAKTRERLKRKINGWLDYDDKIKELNVKAKKYKDAKKQQEEEIIRMITKLGMEDKKIDVHDNNNEMRGRVYRHKSVTKGALKEEIVKNALLEVIRDEKKVDQLIKKIDSKRPINERYYLKRTKGNKD